MIEFLKHLFLHLKVKLKKRHLQINPRGEYLIKYLIDVYVNNPREDKDERYEATINHIEENTSKRSNPVYDKIKEQIKENITEEDEKNIKHFSYAVLLLLSLLSLSAADRRESWLAYINDEERRDFFKNTAI